MTNVDPTAEELTDALKAKDFATARAVATRLGERALADIQTAPNAEVRAAIYRNSIAVLTDALHLARVLRAHLGAGLSTNLGTILYQQPESAQHRWQIQG